MKNKKLLKVTASNFGISALNVFLSAYIPLYLSDAGSDTFAVSAIVAAGFFMGIILQPFSGILSDKLKMTFHTRKIVPLFFGITAAVCIKTIPGFHDKVQLYAAVIILFAAFHIYQVPLSAMVPDNASISERDISSACWSVMGLSGSLSVPLFASLLWNNGRRYIFYVLCIIVSAGVLIPLLFIKENSTSQKRTGGSGMKEILSSATGRTIINFYKMKICWWMGAGFIIPFFPYYMHSVFKINVSGISLIVQSTLTVGIIVSFLLSKRKKNINKFTLMTGSLIYIIIYSVVYMLWDNIYAAVFLMVLYGGVMAIFTAVPLSMLYQIMPRDRFGEFLGIDNIFLNLPQSLSIGAAGILYAVLGIRSIFIISIIFSSVTILLIRRFKQRL